MARVGLVCVLGAVLVLGAAAATVRSERDEAVLAGRRARWVMGGRASGAEMLAWRLDLVQPEEGLVWLDETFWSVSEPSHAAYGDFVTVEELRQHLSPPAKVVSELVAWATSTFGFAQVGPTGDYIFVTGPAAAVERGLGVELRHFVHATSGSQLVRAARSAADLVSRVPVHLRDHVARMVGVDDFPLDARKFVAEATARTRDVVHSTDATAVKVTPPVIWKAYGLADAPTSFPSSATSQSVAEFEQAYFYPADLTYFEQMFGLKVANLTKIVGLNDPNKGYLGECSLDVEYIQVTGRGIDTWMFSQNQFDMTTWAQTVMATSGAPLVHSVSWGSGEQNYQSSEMNSANTEFQKLGALGMTVLTASGDEGTGSTGFFSCGVFSPTFPASSPYVTAVGGTTLASAGAAETGWSKSGGGFSTNFARPSYQEAVVAKYLQSGNLPAQKYWNATGRGIPDVSALATNFQVIISHYLGPLSGTSAATPTWAGVLSVMNGLRSQAGKKPLGFANPALYGLATVGTDILAGDNKQAACPAGFSATTGWDAITGLGTPMFDTLKAGLV